MPFTIPEPLNDILQGIREICITILRTETSSTAGRNNALFGFLLFVILLALLIPDYIITAINTVLSTFNKPLIPQIPNIVIIIYMFILPAYSFWCVWYLNKDLKKF